MRRLRRGAVGLATVLCVASGAAAAGRLTVGAGSSLDLGSATLDLGEHDLEVAGNFSAGTGLVVDAHHVIIQPGGSLDGESAIILLCGSWSNSGTFIAGTSSIRFVDGCGETAVTITGDTTFHDLQLTTSSGKVYALESGSTQTVTDFLTLEGTPGNRLELQSTTPGNEAYIDLQGGQSVISINVQDNYAIGNPLLLGPDSSSLGNTLGWTLQAIPSLPTLGLVLLAGLMALGAVTALRGRSPARS